MFKHYGKGGDGKASFSRCGNYRYSLKREWDIETKKLTFVGLNPSTADANTNDPTIRRCIGLTKQWGYGGFEIVNLFAYRTPTPQMLKKARDPVGPRNSYYLRRALRDSSMVVLIWGNHGSMFDQDEAMLKRLEGQQCYCVGQTTCGAPRHPLYVKNGTKLQVFNQISHEVSSM